MIARIREDVETAFQRDPAARSTLEVLLCYPGLHAIWLHRLAHSCWLRGQRLLARFLSHVNRWVTGIEIHPGATIGRRCFIDHGMGVVIGETAEIGDDCLLYQGVVLGGTSREKEKRHPTLEDHVVVGAGAVVLGPIRLGHKSRVGAGSVVIRSVPPESTVVGIPARLVREVLSREGDLEHGLLPDPLARLIQDLQIQMQGLEERLRQLEESRNGAVSAEASTGHEWARSLGGK